MWNLKAKALQEAINTYGAANQVLKAVEEMSELQQVLCKALAESPKDYFDIGEINPTTLSRVYEEMADVLIMWAQLSLIFNNDRAIEENKRYKLARLAQRILEIKQEAEK